MPRNRPLTERKHRDTGRTANHPDTRFDFERLGSISNLKERKLYCDNVLGEPIGDGTSRYVYQMDDYTAIKLSATIDNRQNREEYLIFRQNRNNPIVPKIYGHASDYSWIWIEKVVPLTPSTIDDAFRKILGITYHAPRNSDSRNSDRYVSVEGFLIWSQLNDPDYTPRRNDEKFRLPSEFVQKIYARLAGTPTWFRNLAGLFGYNQYPIEFHDNNFGIAMRNNRPYIVVTDMGGY